MRSDQAIAETIGLLRGEPVFLAGSCAAAETYDKPDSFGDVDLFVPTSFVLMTTVQCLLDHGYVMDERFSRVWHRWKKYGFKGWHTNSMRLQSLSGMETNVVYKIVDGHPTSSLAQVLESFDMGLLGRGYDLELGRWLDFRPYMFPDITPGGARYPMMPNKEESWLGGYISQYVGLRQPYRYAKYAHEYGYDLSLVKPVLLQGYQMAASYHMASDKEDKQALAEIYTKIGELIEDDGFADMLEAYKVIDFNDPLDQIMAALD